MKFAGFPRGTRYTSVPNPLFGPLLEAIEDPAELKCVVRFMWLIDQRKGRVRYLTARELVSDRVLLAGLKGLGVPAKEAIRRGMRSGLTRGTFLSLPVRLHGQEEELYFLNDEGGRRTKARIEQGVIDIKEVTLREGAAEDPRETEANIFTLYEQNIGLLTPLLAEEMKEAEQTYPWPWIEEAFKVAVGRNKRSWRYIETTLRRWAAEGKGDGESGGYSQETPVTEELVEYLRERGRLPETGRK